MLEKKIFHHFKRKQQFDTKLSSTKQLFFQLQVDDYGVFVVIVDNKGKEVDVSYLSYSGITRNVLRYIEKIKEKNSFVIDWEKPLDHVYLSEHDYLVDQLRLCTNIVDAKMESIKAVDTLATILVKIVEQEVSSSELAPENVRWKSTVQILWEDQIVEEFQLICENTILADRQLIEIPPLGNAFQTLPYFNSEVATTDLSVFLSLLFSNISNVQLSYQDYKLIHSSDKVYAKPALIFEKIDIDKALFMRVGQVLPNTDVSILEQFDLFYFADINVLEKQINIKAIEQESTEGIVQNISKLLRKHRPKTRKKTEMVDVAQTGNLFIIPEVVASSFIYKELSELLLQFQVFGAEKLRSYKVSTVSPSIDLNLKHDIDFFEGEVTLDFEGESMNLFDVINQYNKNHYVKLSDGTHALMNEAYVRRLERIFKKKGKKAQLSFFDLPLVEELIDEKVRENNAIFKKSRSVFEGFNTINSSRTRLPKINATLRSYQKQGYKWLKYLQKNKLGACLADDMGLGKTLQALSLLASIYPDEKKPSLVIMPRSLLFNWGKEVEKFVPSLTTYTFYGNTRDVAEAMKHQLIFTTYAIARNEVEQLKEEAFSYIILDESQNIKNINALTTKAIMLLNSDHRLALSGTPIENNLGELYSLFRFLNPTMFGTLSQFNKDYLMPIQKNNDPVAIDALRKKIYPFVLRRLKKDVLADLPDKIEQILYVEMSAPQRRLYEQRRAFYQQAIKSQIEAQGMQQSRFFIFQALNELRQIASIPESRSDGKIIAPKRELLQEQLLDTIANGHKALVFVNYLSAVEYISEQLQSADIDYVSMTGATRNRQALVDRFQNDPNCKVFLMTLKTGGTGLNLTAANTIFIFDPWWNVAAENQAIDRAHRIGQKNKVLAYKLITEGSIEEKIVQLQNLKKELLDNIISADGASLKSLSEDDIDFILG